MGERKLASVRVIDAIEPIEGADAIEVAIVGGWKVVVKKGEYQPGDLATYIEIDSWVPFELAPFLSKGKEPREFNGVKGERLRTIKLRGQLSQGLLIPTSEYLIEGSGSLYGDGLDLTDALGIQKWERPLPAQLAGKTKGYFPPFLRKTDQERCQNLKKEIREAYENEDLFEVTVKLDGSSMTVYHRKEIAPDDLEVASIGVCSRNLDLKLEGNDENSFVKTAFDTNAFSALEKIGRNVAIQGELIGEGIQGNSEGIKGLRYAIFDVFDIDEQKYLAPKERSDFMNELHEAGFTGTHVERTFTTLRLKSDSIDDLLALAEGKNEAGNEREGLVFKRHDGQFSFKAISNAFLLKGGD